MLPVYTCLLLLSPSSVLANPALLSPLELDARLADFLDFVMLGEVGPRGEERDRRGVEDEHLTGMSDLAVVLTRAAEREPEQCVKRLVCDLATGELGHQDERLLQELQTMSASSDVRRPSTDFRGPIVYGHLFKSVRRCEVRFRCPFSGRQLMALTDSM